MLLDFENESLADILRKLSKKKPLPPYILPVFKFLSEWNRASPYFSAQTSGSTGAPQQIKLEKIKAIQSAKRLLCFLNIRPGDLTLLCLSPEYIAGKLLLVRAIIGRLRLFCSSPSAENLLGTTPAFDFVAMTGNQVHKNIREISKIRHLLIGGSPIHEEFEIKIHEQCPTAQISYGMTETYTQVALRQVTLAKEKIFTALRGVHFSTDNTGRLKIFTKIAVKTPILTDDLVKLKDSQNFIWKGRISNTILSGGLKIIPEESERILANEISQPFFLAGIADEKWGMKIVLLIEESASPQKFSQIREIILRKIPSPKRPKSVVFAETFSFTDSGKIRRNDTLKKISASLISHEEIPLEPLSVP